MILKIQPKEMNQNSYSPNSDFGAYLHISKDELFVLDLSQSTLLEVIDELIKMKQNISPKYGKSLSCLKRHLRIIEQQFKCTLMPIQITDIFWHHFTHHLQCQGISISSIKTLCSQLRSALSWGSRHRAIISPSYDIIQLPAYKHQQIALTPDDVSRIFHFDISSIPKRKQYLSHMEKIRDMFVLSCNLGQRYSDMVRIDKNSFEFNKFSIVQQKTGTKAIVDIDKFCVDRKMVYQILEKYNYNAPFSGDISSYNKYLKYLMEHIGITEEIKRETKVNGMIQTEYIPKHKLIGSHTGRRTFVTINLLRGIPLHEIMRASGHTSYSSFQKYWCYYD